MTLRLSLVIDGDGSGARRALQETAGAVEELGRKTEAAGRQSRTAGSGFEWLSDQEERARLGLKEMAPAANEAARGLSAVDDAGRNASRGFQQAATQAQSAKGEFSSLGNVLIGAAGGLAAGIAIAAIGEGLKAAAGYAQELYREITSNQPGIERALQGHAELVQRIRGAYVEAGGAASTYGLNAQSVLRFDAQQNLAKTEGAFAAAQSDLTESGFFAPIMQDRSGGRDRLGPYRDAINGLRRDLREGTADVIAFREEISAIGGALPEDSEWRSVGQRIRAQIEAASQIQSEMERANDLLRAVEGSAEAASTPLGGSADRFNFQDTQI